jgi:hypothetical protein
MHGISFSGRPAVRHRPLLKTIRLQCGLVAKRREQKIILRSRLPRMKKPGAVSRPGAIREFLFAD